MAILVACLSVGWQSETDLRAEVAAILADEGLAGAAWVLVYPDGALVPGAAGFRDRLERRPFGRDTRFHVGSVAKAVLATGVLRLATQGAVDLDAPMARYLPDLPFDNPWRATAPVTIRHLLDHTSGLEDARLWQLFSERPRPDTRLSDAFPDLLRVRSPPGAHFSYSNTGYGLLGLLVERVTGEPYETYLDANLLGPLGMTRSTFAFTRQDGANPDPALAWGHLDDSRHPSSPVFLRPAGQLTTTSADLGRFATFLMSDGTVGGEPFIAASWMAERGRPSTTLAARAGLEAGYALGLGRRDRHGVVGYCHGGNVVGFVAMLCVYPDEQKGFAYVVNTDSETASYQRLAATLVGALDLRPAVAPPSVALSGVDDWIGTYVPRPNRFATFAYLDTLFGATELSVDNGEVVLDGWFADPRRLRPIGPRRFSAGDRVTTSHVLFEAEPGRRFYSDGFSAHQKVSRVYLLGLRSSLVAGLGGMVWLTVAGLILVVRRGRRFPAHPAFPALAGVIALLVPVPLLVTQSFLALGDATAGAVAVAVVTGALPVAMLATLVRLARARGRSRWWLAHGLAAGLVLQWCVVLATHGLVPVVLWS